MKSRLSAIALSVLSLVLSAGAARAQYTPAAAKSAPTVTRDISEKDAQGNVHHRKMEVAAPTDGWGNAAGNQNDLAIDGAFEGQTVVVLHLYTGEGFDFSLPKAALREKGFSVFRYLNQPPSAPELKKSLDKACQLWIISGASPLLTPAHIKIIKEFFDSGRGVYIWGDNEPYYADANQVAEALLGTTMLGNVPGDQTVGLEKTVNGPGILPNHLLTTGLAHIYEGVTIATIQPSQDLKPLIHGSAGNLVAAYYDKGGKRAILDGGFTRLFLKWDTAGTARYVKNAAAWLTNFERFGQAVVSANLKKK